MIIQYASDLHLEFAENKQFLKANPLQPKGDILLLAGDVTPFSVMNQHNDFFSYAANNFEHTYWIPGNHEYYHFDVAEKCGTLNERIKTNVHLVNNITIEQAGVKIIFSTLWSKINPADGWEIEKFMNDFHQIKYKGYRFSIDRFNELHEESRTFVEQELIKESAFKKIVVTHHVPTFLNYPEAYKGDVLNEAFAVELFDLIETNGPDYWIYGHHHHNTPDFVINKTQMLTNQLGYVQYDEQKLFNCGKTIEV